MLTVSATIECEGIRRILTEARAAEPANGWVSVATSDGGRMTISIKYLDDAPDFDTLNILVDVLTPEISCLVHRLMQECDLMSWPMAFAASPSVARAIDCDWPKVEVVASAATLHPLLAQSINPRKVLGTEYRDVQQHLTRYYLGNSTSLVAATEAFFHATEAGDDHLTSMAQPFFVEQLHLRGRSLSKQKRHRDAAEIFRQAVELDPTDDYAHHYHAFNLDWIAEALWGKKT